MFCDFFFKFLIYIMICQIPRKNLDCKIQITINGNFNEYFFQYQAMFLILITQFHGKLSIIGVLHTSHPQSFFLYEWSGNFKFCKIQRINLMEVCHVLLIMLSLMHISGDHKQYFHLGDIKRFVVFFVLSHCVEVACKGLSLIQ